MKSTLIDAGPMIALFDRDDRFHTPVKRFFSKYREPFVTTWPVITEASYMLHFSVDVQIDFLKWINRGAFTFFNLEMEHLEHLIELSGKYADVPMDLADGSLLVASEYTGIRTIVTIDSDYYIYRTKDGQYLENILKPYID